MRDPNPFPMLLGSYPEWGDYALLVSCAALVLYSFYLGWWIWKNQVVGGAR